MEFSEKLKELRKSRGLTQEELAELLFVSRTAVSKWESGRGLPNIDSLKALGVVFSVSVDELIRSETAITLAEREKKASIFAYAAIICYAMDAFTGLLLFLPVFGAHSLDVFALREFARWEQLAFISVIGLNLLNGICGLIILRLEKPIWLKHRLYTGLALSVLGTAIFIAARQPYAAMVYFAILLLKIVVLFEKK